MGQLAGAAGLASSLPAVLAAKAHLARYEHMAGRRFDARAA